MKCEQELTCAKYKFCPGPELTNNKMQNLFIKPTLRVFLDQLSSSQIDFPSVISTAYFENVFETSQHESRYKFTPLIVANNETNHERRGFSKVNAIDGTNCGAKVKKHLFCAFCFLPDKPFFYCCN